MLGCAVGVGVRINVNEELKYLLKSKKKQVGGGGWVRRVSVGGWGAVRMNVNEKFKFCEN